MHKWFSAPLTGLVFLAACTAAPAQQEKPSDQPGDAQQRQPRRNGFGGPGGRFGGFDRDFMRRMREATPEQARQMRIDGWVDMLTRSYDLTDEQKVTVRAEVKKLSDEYRTSLGKDAAEMDKIESQMRDYWIKRADQEEAAQKKAETEENTGRAERPQRTNPWEDPEFARLAERMRDLRQEHPIDWQAGVDRIESLLPADQVEKGHQRRDEWMRNMQNRRGNNGDNNNQQQQQNQNRQRRNRRRNRDAESQQTDPPRGPLAGGPARTPVVPAQPPAPPHPWDIYTDHFIDQNTLTAAQANSAHAIVKELKTRQAALKTSQINARAQADKLPNDAKTAKLKELDAPLDALFTELKTRLDGLLTAEQRAKNNAKA